MASVPNATVNRTSPLKSGVMLGVSPSSDPTFDMEIARATSSGVYATVARMTPKGDGSPVVFTDLLPVDGRARSYKGRAVKDGWNASAYTAVVTAKPTYLPDVAPNITPLTGKAIGSNMFLSTGQAVAFGGVASPSSYGGHSRTAALLFRPKSSGISYSYGIGTLVPTSRNASTAANYSATVPLPVGVSVYKASWYYVRSTAGAVFRAELYAVSTAGVATSKYAQTSAAVSGGVQVLSSSSFAAFTINSGYVVSQVAMKSTQVGGNKSQLVALDLYYRTPSVQVAL